MTTILNFAPATNELRSDLFCNTDYLILNEIEAEQLSGHSVGDIDQAKIASETILEKFDVAIGVVVTLGSNGVFYMDKLTKKSIHQKCHNVKVVDTSVSLKNIKT